jgi:hypothetical protein
VVAGREVTDRFTLVSLVASRPRRVRLADLPRLRLGTADLAGAFEP